MIIPKKLYFSGVGRFVDKQIIDFTQLSSLTQVEGQNENTGGSSGAGKSTIFKILDFIFGIKGVSATLLQSRLTEEKMDIVFECDYDGVPLTIQRGHTFMIDHNGEITKGSAKLTEEKLDKIIGMPRELFGKILHKRQKEGGFFLEMGPTDVHSFLTRCLSLDSEMAKVAVLDKEIDSINNSVVKKNLDLSASQGALQATLTGKSSLVEPKCSVDSTIVEKLKGAYDIQKNKVTEVIALQTAEMRELESKKPEFTTVAFDRSPIVDLETRIQKVRGEVLSLELEERNRQSAASKKLGELNSTIFALKSQIKDGDRAEQDARALMEQVKKIKEAICPTCEQSWITQSAKLKESELTDRALKFKGAVVAGMKAKASLPDIEVQLASLNEEAKPKQVDTYSLNQKVVQMNQELVQLRSNETAHNELQGLKNKGIRDTYDQQVFELRSRHKVVLEAANKESSATSDAYLGAKREWDYFGESWRVYKDSCERFNDQETKYKVQCESLEKSIADLKSRLELAQEAKKMIKSYVASKFENALESIGDAATRIIRGIPNMSTATIQLDGLKETKEGKIKEEINAIVSMDGEIGIPIKSLSGGERSSTDLAVDLAVIQFIEEQTGKGIGLLILDEPFDGLDFESSSNAIEALKVANNGKIILLVDHNPMLKEYIEDKITVIRSGSTSRIA